MPVSPALAGILAEFAQIAESVVFQWRDHAMIAVTQLDGDDMQCLYDIQGECGGSDKIQPDPQIIMLDPRSNTHRAGVAQPTSAVLEEHACFLVIHGRPRTDNHFAGIAMDLAHHVDLSTVYAHLLLQAMSPRSGNAQTTFSRLAVGVIAQPQSYVDIIWEWNTSGHGELIMISQGTDLREMMHPNGGANITEIDIIRHLAMCGVTQAMVDSCYIYAIHYLDQFDLGTNILMDWYNRIDDDRHQRLASYEVQVGDTELHQWWEPNYDTLVRVCEVQDIEYWQSKHARWCYNSHAWHLFGESPLFTHLCSR